jgi:hypothetical protein
MILYTILIIVFGLLTLVSIITFIVGLVKKRKSIISTGLILFVIGICGCFFSGYKTAKTTLDYVKSKEFQDDTKKGTEFIGVTVGSATSGLSEGLSKTLDEDAISKLAEKSGAILGKSIKTMASSLDSTIGNTNIYIDKTLQSDNLSLGRAEEKYKSNSNDLGIFIETKTDFKGKLKLTNYDQSGKVIEAVEKVVNFKANKGNVEVFSFYNSNFGITTYFILSKVTE